MMKGKNKSTLPALVILILFACQTLPATLSAVPTATKTTVAPQSTKETPTATAPIATEIPTATSTSVFASAKTLAGLILSSPILGSALEVPGTHPPDVITPNGLGLINSEGKLIKFADAGVLEGFSPSGVQIVYQHGFEGETTDYIDDLYVYDAMNGTTTQILDSLEQEGGKTILSWSQDERKFLYYNDYFTVLFEAYGYFEPKQLLMTDVSTGRTRLLIRDGYQFDVSPDQTQIAYTTGKILDEKTETYGGQPLKKFGCFQPRIYDIASFSSHSFNMRGLSEKPVCVGYPKWSPDGKKIAWIGYFQDDTFRPSIFDLQSKTGTIYEALDQKPESSNLPTDWYLGEGTPEPDWIDNSTLWTPSYELNIETGETSIPRKRNEPYYYRSDRYIISPDGRFHVSLSEDRNAIELSDVNDNLLASFLLGELYDGPKQEILTTPFFLPGVPNIVGWSPFASSLNHSNP